MGALGAPPLRVTPARVLVLVGWQRSPGSLCRPHPDRWVDDDVAMGDTATFTFIAVDQTGAAIAVPRVTWSLLDSGALVRLPVKDSDWPSPTPPRLATEPCRVDERAVLAWRFRFPAGGPIRSHDHRHQDRGRTVLASDDFAHGLTTEKWMATRDPLPGVGPAPDGSGAAALYPNAGAGFGSGVLSTGTIELSQGLDIEGRFYAPFNEAALLPGSIELALVAPVTAPTRGTRPPELARLLSVSWSGQTGKVTYAVGTRTYQEPGSALGAGGSHVVRLAIGSGDSVALFRKTGTFDGGHRF